MGGAILPSVPTFPILLLRMGFPKKDKHKYPSSSFPVLGLQSYQSIPQSPPSLAFPWQPPLLLYSFGNPSAQKPTEANYFASMLTFVFAFVWEPLLKQRALDANFNFRAFD